MLFCKKNRRSFTYFIPAPPLRKSGYQEKELDNILNKIIEYGFKVVELKVSTIETETTKGVWVFTLLEAKSPQAKALAFDFDMQSLLPAEEPTDIIYE